MSKQSLLQELADRAAVELARVLVDTSVWIDHLRSGEPLLVAALEGGRIMMHPFVLGELACGNLANRSEVLRLLGALPAAPTATDPEALEFIERCALMGRGIGYIDVHLLASIACRAMRACGQGTGASPQWRGN